MKTKRQKLISGEDTDYQADPVDRLSALPDHIICHNILSLLPANLSVRTSSLAKRWRFTWAHIPNFDRLSALPEKIICRILSFLPTTKHSVKTSIFAKRWRYMWAHVPNLSFDSSKQQKGTWSISNVINRVMLLHKLQHIDSFHMNLLFSTRNGICNENDIDTWITTLIARNIQKLHLFCDHPHYVLKLPTCLFTCKTLVDLSLDTGGHNRTIILMTWTAWYVYLPALKKLRLHGIYYDSDEALPHLLSGCPVLEELSMLHPQSNDVCWMEPKQVPTCMVSHLRIVMIEEFGCTKEEENMVRYILRNAIVLKRMVIECIHHGIDLNIDLKGKYKALERISLFERGSKACELTFCRD